MTSLSVFASLWKNSPDTLYVKGVLTHPRCLSANCAFSTLSLNSPEKHCNHKPHLSSTAMLLGCFAVIAWQAQPLDEPPTTPQHKQLLIHTLHIQRMLESGSKTHFSYGSWDRELNKTVQLLPDSPSFPDMDLYALNSI